MKISKASSAFHATPNPTGDVYTDENMSEMLEAGKSYSNEFLFILDHAYLLHDFSPTLDQTPSWELAKKFDVLDQTAIFCSFSKVTFGGGGLSFCCSRYQAFNLLARQRGSMIVCSDKVNQMRYIGLKKQARCFKSYEQACTYCRLKFEVAFKALDSLSSEIGSYKKPTVDILLIQYKQTHC